MGAGFPQCLPAIGEGELPPDALAAGFKQNARHAKADNRLHGGDNAQLLETWDVGGIDDFDMLDAMT